MDGEEWKNAGRISEDSASPEGTYLKEYQSILKSFYRNALDSSQIVGQEIDRDSLQLVLSDLEWKTQAKEFEHLPLKLKLAYTNFLELVRVLENTDDKQIKTHRELIKGVRDLSIDCYCYSDSFSSGAFRGENRCRGTQHSLLSKLAKAKRKTDSPLIGAIARFIETCDKCPYK